MGQTHNPSGQSLTSWCAHPQCKSLDITRLGQVSNHKVSLLFAMATYPSGQLACHQQNVTQIHRAELRIFVSMFKPNGQNAQEGKVQNPETAALRSSASACSLSLFNYGLSKTVQGRIHPHKGKLGTE